MMSTMDYEFTTGTPITENEALAQVAAMGFHGFAFDDTHTTDELLHWHEFDAVAWVITGTGSIAHENGEVTLIQPGCRLQAPAGYLHRTLAGTDTRVVVGTSLKYEDWTRPINKAPAERPAALAT